MILYILRNKDENYCRFLIRNYANQKKMRYTYRVLKEKKIVKQNFLPRKKKSLKIADEIRTFSDKQNLQEFCPSRPAGGMN